MLTKDDSKELLLVRKKETDQWTLPSGGFTYSEAENRFETPLEAALREMKEETGSVLESNLRLKAVIPIPGKDKGLGKISGV